MSVEQGYIEYVFTQHGADGVLKVIKEIDQTSQDGAKRFNDMEKAIKKMASGTGSLASEARKVATEMSKLDSSDVSNLEQEWSALTQEIADAEAQYRKFRQAQVLGIDGVSAPNLSAEDLRLYADAMEAARSSIFGTGDSIASQRYALYDLASTYAALGTAMSAVGVYAVTVGAQFESAFTQVERTMSDLGDTSSIDSLRQSLVQLSGRIPLTFAELSEIAKIGNQMEIPIAQMENFTNVVAKFASLSEMSVDSVAEAFGRIQNLSGLEPQYFENLGSAIVQVGLETQATETQIIAIMREITALTTRAGFAIDETIGLAGAMAALAIAPENARGSLSLYQKALTRALADGGAAMENFATITGLTADELDRMVRSGEGADIFVRFLEGMSNASDIVEVQQALDAVGLNAQRASESIGKLAGDTSLLIGQMTTAQRAFMEGAALQERYNLTLDDLSSQFVIFINGLNALVATITGNAVPGLAGLLAIVNNLIFGFQEWLVENPIAARLLAIGGAIITVTGAFALLNAGLALARGSMLAFALVQRAANSAGLAGVGTFRSLAAAMLGTGQSAIAAARGVNVLRSALIRLPVIGLLAWGATELASAFIDVGGQASDAALSLDEYNAAMRSLNSAGSGAADDAQSLADRLGGGGGVADSAKKAAEQVRLLADYAQELSGVFSRSIELRFSSQSAMDDIALKWIELNEQLQEYQRTIRTLTADRELKAYWLSIAEAYDDQLRAGQLREELAKIDDDLAKANAGASRELEGQSRSAIENRRVMTGLIDQYEDYITALAKSGASQEFVQAEIQRLNAEFMDQATALGYSADELARYERSFVDFSKIAAQMPSNISIGFDLDPAQQALNEFFAKARADAAATGAGMGDAMGGGFGGGLDDFLDSYVPNFDYSEPMKAAGAKSGKNWGEEVWRQFLEVFSPDAVTNEAVVTGARWGLGLRGGIDRSGWYTGVFSGGVGATLSAEAVNAGYAAGATFSSGFGNAVRNNLGGAVRGALSSLRVTISGSGLPGYAGGGYTGAGHRLQPKGLVHGGEYVIPKHGVDQRTKLPKMDYVASLNRGERARKGIGYSSGGYASGMAQPVRIVNDVNLGARTMSGMSAFGGTDVNIGDRMVAEAASRGSRFDAMIGAA